MVDCLRDQQDPTGSSPGFQARLKPRLQTRRLAGGIGDQTTGRQGQLASKFRSRLAAKLAASLYYVLFYYTDIVDTERAQLTSADPLRVGAGPIEMTAIW